MESEARRRQSRSGRIRAGASIVATTLAVSMWTAMAAADVPVRVSVKFIVDASGNRPATGRFNTTAEVNAEADAGSDILRGMISEHRIQVTEILDLPTSLSSWSTISVGAANRDLVRNAALADPTTWSWRTNAVNYYVTGGSGSAYSDFPPNNNIVLFGQGCTNSPSCLLHELGHSLNLLHTHQGGGADGCSDTLQDNSSWSTTDQMAQANYGLNYASLTAAQQNLVDQTWSNFMSYHTSPPQLRYSPCQKDRASTQGYTDRNWLLAKQPVYVGSCVIFCNGSFVLPYPNIQAALTAGGLTGKVIVLDDIDTLITQSDINFNVEIDTRQGTSHIDQGAMDYVLPTNLEESSDPAVGDAVRAAKDENTRARRAMRDAEDEAVRAATAEDRDRIRSNAKKLDKEHRDKAIEHLLRAENRATGDERIALQLELAERYWHRAEYDQSMAFYNQVAADTDQPPLRERALVHAQQCQDKLDAATAQPGTDDSGEPLAQP
ncbi:MAG: hypothetical protein JRH01_21870 [Deltaproteobacteria bacterium]|nr:hypothetical protein [Deltaproteobacteria bacterium]